MKKPATSRLFAVVTYIADPAQIISIICAKSKQIRSFAYIFHDRDKAPPHHHLVIRTHNSRTCKEICNWFKDDVNNQNTFAAFVESPEGILSYLTHANDPEQTQYDDSEVTDGGIADILTVANAKDTTADIIDDILAGVSYRTLVYRYGRDLVVNYNRYNDFAAMVAAQDRKESEEMDENPVSASPNYTKL